MIFNINKSSELLTKLEIIKNTLDKQQKIRQQKSRELNQSNILIDKLIKEYKDNLYKEKTCPFCLSEIDDNHVDQIIKELRK